LSPIAKGRKFIENAGGYEIKGLAHIGTVHAVIEQNLASVQRVIGGSNHMKKRGLLFGLSPA
jgi:hypothetical protein